MQAAYTRRVCTLINSTACLHTRVTMITDWLAASKEAAKANIYSSTGSLAGPTLASLQSASSLKPRAGCHPRCTNHQKIPSSISKSSIPKRKRRSALSYKAHFLTRSKLMLKDSTTCRLVRIIAAQQRLALKTRQERRQTRQRHRN